MGELYSRDASRIYVWYPDKPTLNTLPDWEHDPSIAEYLRDMRSDGQYELSAARYYWNPKPTGQLIVIARLVYPD